MTLVPLAGHYEARRRLARALTQGRLPQVLLLTGPRGIGKQRLGLWLAQLVFCDAAASDRIEPCGSCRGCQLVVGLRHPDLHWVVPILRPKASDAAKQIEEAAEAIALVMEERRKAPLYDPPSGMAMHGVATARLIARKVSLTPVEGRRKVFVIGDAERLVPQEASPEAANAMLKLLEEPPADTILILTAADAKALLPTVASRTVIIRLAPLGNDDVSAFLRAYVRPELDDTEVESRVGLAEGSIGRALWEAEDASKVRALATGFLEAVLDNEVRVRESVLGQAPWSARGGFSEMLAAMAETLSDAARAALGHEPRRAVPRMLRDRDPEGLVKALGLVAEAQEAARGNVNPQLLLAVLGERLGATL